jgi:hypothetical protein
MRPKVSLFKLKAANEERMFLLVSQDYAALTQGNALLGLGRQLRRLSNSSFNIP